MEFSCRELLNMRAIFLRLLTALLFLSTSSSALGAASREDFTKRIRTACEKTTSNFIDNNKAVCECVYRNYNNVTISIENLELITYSHEGNQKVQDQLQDKKYSDLMLMDYDITEGCVKNSKYTYKQK